MEMFPLLEKSNEKLIVLSINTKKKTLIVLTIYSENKF